MSELLDHKAKRARNTQKARGSKNEKEVVSRQMRAGCKDGCRYKCQIKISRNERNQIFKEFWLIGDHVRQWCWITNHIERKEPAQSKAYSNSEDECKRRKVTHVYMLPTSNQNVKVCKTMFFDTLGISSKRMETAEKKFRITGELPNSDDRGKHQNRPYRVPDSLRNTAREHIESFPLMESHYCWAEFPKKCLEEGLNITKMYRLYLEIMTEKKSDEKVSQQMYAKIFNTEYNYEFYTPKKDRCDQCALYNNQSEEEKIASEERHNLHLRNKKTIGKLLKADKVRSNQDSTFTTAMYDLQKTLMTPKTEIGPLYYLSKLNVWNFTIYEAASHQGYCFVWNESLGQKGSNEVASFVHKFIKEKTNARVNDFVFYSETCTEHNRNKNILTMYIKASADLNIKIIHRYLEPGHTWCEIDSMHGCIERQCRHKSIYTQKQWCMEMEKAKTTPPAYTVKEIEQKDIYNYSNLAKYFKWSSVNMSNITEVEVSSGGENIRFKFEEHDCDWSELSVLKSQFSITDIKNYELKEAYQDPFLLSDKKHEDFATMINKNIIPKEFHPFFRSFK